MQLSNDSNLVAISKKTNFAIFELPETDFATIFTDSLHFHPGEKGSYLVDDIKAIMDATHGKQTEDFTIVIEDADKMPEKSANKLLKTLEEPGNKVHFVFLVRNSSQILTTIKSRAHNYYLPANIKISEPPKIDIKLLATAKSYIACKPEELPKFCEKIAKKKDTARTDALAIVDAAIQLIYKTYFVTGEQKYLRKLESLLDAQAALKANGHIKLHLVIGML